VHSGFLPSIIFSIIIQYIIISNNNRQRHGQTYAPYPPLWKRRLRKLRRRVWDVASEKLWQVVAPLASLLPSGSPRRHREILPFTVRPGFHRAYASTSARRTALRFTALYVMSSTHISVASYTPRTGTFYENRRVRTDAPRPRPYVF